MAATEVFKIMGGIAGLGGLSLSVFIVLHQVLIKKVSFPKLRQEDAYRTIRLALLSIWSITVVGIAAYVWLQLYTASPNGEPGKKIVTSTDPVVPAAEVKPHDPTPQASPPQPETPAPPIFKVWGRIAGPKVDKNFVSGGVSFLNLSDSLKEDAGADFGEESWIAHVVGLKSEDPFATVSAWMNVSESNGQQYYASANAETYILGLGQHPQNPGPPLFFVTQDQLQLAAFRIAQNKTTEVAGRFACIRQYAATSNRNKLQELYDCWSGVSQKDKMEYFRAQHFKSEVFYSLETAMALGGGKLNETEMAAYLHTVFLGPCEAIPYYAGLAPNISGTKKIALTLNSVYLSNARLQCARINGEVREEMIQKAVFDIRQILKFPADGETEKGFYKTLIGNWYDLIALRAPLRANERYYKAIDVVNYYLDGTQSEEMWSFVERGNRFYGEQIFVDNKSNRHSKRDQIARNVVTLYSFR